MNITARPYFDQPNIQGIDDVLYALEMLGHDLPVNGLANLVYFNQTYLIITRNVRQQLRKGSFDDPAFLERFDARFAGYYLQALHGHLTGRSVSHAWQAAFEAAEAQSMSPLGCMALGVNAHVNNDIPQVLRDCGARPEQYRDFLRVNRIIQRSLHEVLDVFAQDRRLLGPQRRWSRPAYVLGMHQLIRVWRYSAWRKFRLLERRDMTVGAIEALAGRMSRGISRIPL